MRARSSLSEDQRAVAVALFEKARARVPSPRSWVRAGTRSETCTTDGWSEAEERW